jgi:hypothetical protein
MGFENERESFRQSFSPQSFGLIVVESLPFLVGPCRFPLELPTSVHSLRRERVRTSVQTQCLQQRFEGLMPWLSANLSF